LCLLSAGGCADVLLIFYAWSFVVLLDTDGTPTRAPINHSF
jgi:hypothetical protein